MAAQKCETCEELLEDENFGCEACGSGTDSGSIMCMSCSMKQECNVCQNSCCVHCVSAKHLCCGKIICGSGALVGDYVGTKEAAGIGHPCIRDHETRRLDCSHLGCNFYEGCYVCELEAESGNLERDKVLVKELLDRATSVALKAVLQNFLADPHHHRPSSAWMDELTHDA